MAKHRGRAYRVIYSSLHRQAIHALGERAAHCDILGVYLDALRAMDRSLATNPVRWGDPQNRLRKLGLSLFHRVQGPLHITYAVDKQRKLVYLRAIQPTPNLWPDESD